MQASPICPEITEDICPKKVSNQRIAADFPEMIGTCPKMLRVFQLIHKVAVTDVPIMITGASGTGKEMVAQAVHKRSARAHAPFVVVNCGAIPRELMESELFGHERGAFTGAYHTAEGKVELAHCGTLFLDEVGELPLDLQVKLLRFLQDFTFERIGDRRSRKVDVRVISATNANLQGLITAGRFREDLYYRLNCINIDLPLLKDRGEDILIIADTFLKRYAKQTGKKVLGFSREALQALQAHYWPGNIRELINAIRRGLVMAEGMWVTPQNLGLEKASIVIDTAGGLGLKEALAQFEMKMITQALANSRGNLQLAAKNLKTSRSVIYHLINKHNLR
jgi:two-component system, NtrC family, response regulator